MGDSPILAGIALFAGTFAPRGWADCSGQILPINQNQSLYSLLGTTYGGDGRTTFGLPDLRGRAAMHPDSSIGSLGMRSGSESINLSLAQMPAHTHTVTNGSIQVAIADQTGTTFNAKNNVLGAQGVDVQTGADIEAYVETPTYNNNNALGGVEGTTSILNAGGGQAVYTMNPYLTVRFCIAVEGLFPSRD